MFVLPMLLDNDVESVKKGDEAKESCRTSMNYNDHNKAISL